MTTAAAAVPRSQSLWRANPDGTVRSLEEALDIGRRHGLEVDDDRLLWAVGAPADFQPGELATYARVRALSDRSVVRRDLLLTRRQRFRILLNPSILASDDAILAVLAHEAYEILELDAAFEPTGEMSGRELRSLIDTTVGTLHCEAWDEADRIVLALIEADEWP